MIDIHKGDVDDVLDKLMCSNVTFCMVATCTRASGHMGICHF